MKASEEARSPVLHRTNRIVSRWGIHWHWLLYNDGELQQARLRNGGDFRADVHLDPEDVGAVLAALPEGSFLKVPACRSDYAAGLSLEAHRRNLDLRGAIPIDHNMGDPAGPLFGSDLSSLKDEPGANGEME